MVACKFYAQGRCKFGDNCKFDHIDGPTPPNRQRNGQNNNNNDPFSAPSHGGNNSYRPKKGGKEQAPKWPLSAIGIRDNGQDGNELTGDCSPEELRALAYSMAPRGMSHEVQQREGQMVSEHQAKVDALSRGGMQMTAGGNGNSAQKDPFAQGGSGSGSGFGGGFGSPNQQSQPSGFAQQPSNPFGNTPQQPANPFGQGQSTPTQPSGFGRPPQQQQQQQQPQQQQPQQNNPPSQPVTPAAQEQFSAAAFGFAKVPETAPPPQYYN